MNVEIQVALISQLLILLVTNQLYRKGKKNLGSQIPIAEQVLFLFISKGALKIAPKIATGKEHGIVGKY